MSQSTSNLHHKHQHSSTSPRSNPQQHIDQLNPGVEEYIASFYQDQDDADERDSGSDDDNSNETEDDKRDNDGDRRDTLGEKERNDNTIC
jgi:hypothetical protein